MTSRRRSPSVRGAMRVLGATLLVFSFVPIYRLMDTSGDAPHRLASVEIADATLQLAWWGTVVTVLLAFVLAVLLPTHALRARVADAAARLERVPEGRYALLLGVLATGLATVVAFGLYRGYFTNVDEIASTVHARYLASGSLAGPTFSVPEFWLIPNTLVVPEGWVSQYPPTHIVAMAVVALLGIPVLLGPLSFGVMVGLLALSLGRLLPDRPKSARVAALAIAVCPFLVLLGGGSMNHVTTGALLAAALWASLRARDGGAAWSILAGLAVGLAVADRPLVGLVLGSVFTLGVWGPPALRAAERAPTWLAARAAGTVLGGAPIAVLLGWYNQRLFGAPGTLGYLVAYGERHRLGFHPDPWGSPYGIGDAAAFTSTDVLNASGQLLETPFPATALIGVALLVGARLSSATGLLLAWAFLPVVANAYYWFHDARMLFEAAPAWVALFVLSAAWLARPGTRPPSDARGRLGALARDTCAWVLVVGGVFAVWNARTRWMSYSWTEETRARIEAPAPPTSDPALVFVHASWNERLSAKLQGAGGMRQDSVIGAIRRNTNCALHEYALAREARLRNGHAAPLPEVDLTQRSGAPEDILRPPSPTGATLRVREGERFSPSCLRELRADRFGAVALAPLLWQGDLPGIERGRTMFVRDLGPERNETLLALWPDRVPLAFTPIEVEGPPRLLPYAEAMELLWGPSAATAQGS